MSRLKDFDEAQTLQRMADAFIANGYRGTSMAMLEEVTGLGKQSLYNAFGNKNDMYLKSVECATGRLSPVIASMQKAGTGFEAVAVFFEGLLQACNSRDPVQSRCVVSSGLMEQVDDANLENCLQEKWQSVMAVFRQHALAGQEDGSIRSDISADQLAALLMTIMSGMRVTSRVIGDPRKLRELVMLALEVLKSTA